MGYLENIGRGFRLVNENWQLVLIQALLLVINVAGFLILVVIPLIAGIAAFGLDASRLGELESLFMNIDNLYNFISEYIGLLLVVLLGVLVYVTFAFSIWVYVFGGSAGVLGKAIKDPSSRFSAKTFFSEGKRLFFPLIGYLTVVGLILIGISIMLGLLSFIAVLLSEAIGPGDTFTGIFFKVLFTLGIVLLTIIVFFLVFALSAVGAASLLLDGTGPMVSLERGFKHLNNHRGFLWLIGLLILGYGGIQLIITLIGYSIQTTDLMLLSIPYQILANIFQGYLSLVVLATFLAYFYFATSGYSTQASDISPSGASPSAPLPEGADDH